MASGTAELTIDELARETGMTVRNIRAHQSRGQLPPPAVRARTSGGGSRPRDWWARMLRTVIPVSRASSSIVSSAVA